MVDRVVNGDKMILTDLTKKTVLSDKENKSKKFTEILEDMPLYGYFGKKIQKLFTSLY